MEPNPEGHFGTVRNHYYEDRSPPYDPKPAYLAMCTLTTRLSGMRLARRISTPSDDHYVLVFVHDAAQPAPVFAAWTTLASAQSVTFHAGEVEPGALYATSDHLGNRTGTIRASASGDLHLSVSVSVTYIYRSER